MPDQPMDITPTSVATTANGPAKQGPAKAVLAAAARSRQPTKDELERAGIKVRDFGYESTLPPVKTVYRQAKQVLPSVNDDAPSSSQPSSQPLQRVDTEPFIPDATVDATTGRRQIGWKQNQPTQDNAVLPTASHIGTSAEGARQTSLAPVTHPSPASTLPPSPLPSREQSSPLANSQIVNQDLHTGASWSSESLGAKYLHPPTHQTRTTRVSGSPSRSSIESTGSVDSLASQRVVSPLRPKKRKAAGPPAILPTPPPPPPVPSALTERYRLRSRVVTDQPPRPRRSRTRSTKPKGLHTGQAKEQVGPSKASRPKKETQGATPRKKRRLT